MPFCVFSISFLQRLLDNIQQAYRNATTTSTVHNLDWSGRSDSMSKRYRHKLDHIWQRNLKRQKFRQLFKNLAENWQWGGNAGLPAKKGLKDVILRTLVKYVFFPKAAIPVDWRKATCKTMSLGTYKRRGITILIFFQSLL